MAKQDKARWCFVCKSPTVYYEIINEHIVCDKCNAELEMEPDNVKEEKTVVKAVPPKIKNVPVQEVKRGRGRPKGSKNKQKFTNPAAINRNIPIELVDNIPAKRGPGRPPKDNSQTAIAAKSGNNQTITLNKSDLRKYITLVARQREINKQIRMLVNAAK